MSEVKSERIEFSCPDGELDEVFIAKASVHIERMSDTAYWIGIEPEGKPPLNLHTGAHRGTWYFRIEVDDLDNHYEGLDVQRPRKSVQIPAPRIKERIARLEQDNERLKEADADYQSRLWCALGQPINVEYIEAVKRIRQERDALKAKVAALEEEIALRVEQGTALNADKERFKAQVERLTAPVSEEDVFAFSLDTLDPQESIPVLLAARAAEPGSKEPHD